MCHHESELPVLARAITGLAWPWRLHRYWGRSLLQFGLAQSAGGVFSDASPRNFVFLRAAKWAGTRSGADWPQSESWQVAGGGAGGQTRAGTCPFDGGAGARRSDRPTPRTDSKGGPNAGEKWPIQKC